MAATNERIYRTNVVLDLLDQAISEDNDFDSLDLDAMRVEIRSVIVEQEQSNPPENLNEFNDETVTWMREVRNVVVAAGSADLGDYNESLEDYNALLAQETIDPFKACGFE